MEIALDDDIAYINRMREEIAEAENTPNDIEPMRRHSTFDMVLMLEGMMPVSGQENALDLMTQLWSVFDVKIHYHSEEVKINGDTALDRGWAEERLTNRSTGEVIDNLYNYLWLSRREVNGTWKQTHVICNKRPR